MERYPIVAMETGPPLARATPRPTHDACVAASGQRVLVVEDDAGLASVVELLLRHYGFVPQMAATLADARRHLAGADPDVIVLDLNLPDGTGVDLLEHLRSTGRRARVVVLTAGTTAEHLTRLRFLKPDRVFRKPMNFLELLDGIRAEVADASVGIAGRAATAAGWLGG